MLKYFSRSVFFIAVLFTSTLLSTSSAQEDPTPETPKENVSSAGKDEKDMGKDIETKNTDDNKEKDVNKRAKIAAPINIYQQTQADIKHYLPDQGVQPLLAGPDDYLTLVEESHTAINKGVAILIPDFPIGAATPKSINYLRKTLPVEGWTTMTVQPSYSPENYPSINIDEKSRLQENAEALEAYQAKLKQLIPAIMEKAKAYPGLFLVIAEGTHAAMLMNIYQQDIDNLPSAIVMLSAYLPTEIESMASAQNMVMLETPVLDLYLRSDHPLAIKNSKLRKKLAQKELKVYYRQQKIYNLSTSYYPPETLLKAINGWLKSIGW